MTGWQLDATRFVEDVLKPVQDGWRPEEDLFRTYLLPPDVTDAGTVRAALDGINRELTKQKYRAFTRACGLLRAGHKDAAAVLTDSARRSAHRKDVAERARKLGASLRQHLHGAPGLPAAGIEALARGFRGDFTRTAIRAALAEVGARELEPAELPDTPEPGRWTETRTLLGQLHQGSLWDYLAMVLAGPGTSTRQIQARREQLRVSRDADSTAETTVLKLVQQWITAGELAGVLRHEVLTELAGAVRYGYAEVARAAAAVSHRLADVGFPPDPDALAYAVWCRHHTADGGQAPGWQEDYQAAVRELELRRALAVLDAQPGLSDEWRTQRDRLDAQVVELDKEIARCRALERTDVEAAVAGYLRVRERLADPEIETAIERCRPAEPGPATATPRDGRVVVTWLPSTATAGRIGYRVARAGTVICAETGGLEAVDESPPGGTPLTYEVHTLRSGNPSERPARPGPVTVLPEVLDLELRGEPDAISGRWRLPDGATGASVTRDGEPVRDDVRSTGFVDRDVRPGRSYEYLVRASYRLPNGTQALSAGRHAATSCQELPVAVTDLAVELDGDEVVARWTPPARGEVEILQLRPGADRPDQEVVASAAARRFGTTLRASGPTVRGRLRGRLETPSKQQVLVPVTVLGELAAIGEPRVLDLRQGSVRSLRARRFGATVRLTWEWPAGAAEVRVVWRTAAKPTGPTDPEASVLNVTRVTYDSRGASLSVPAGEHWFGVCTVLTEGAEQSFGPLVLTREETTATASYAIKRIGWRRSSRRILLIEFGPGRELPPVVLTAKSGVRPMDPDDGERLLRTEAGIAPLRAEFSVPAHLRRPVHLRAFSTDEGLVLRPTNPDELMLT